MPRLICKMATHETPQPSLEAVAIVEAMRPSQIDAARMMLTSTVNGKLVRRFGEPGNYRYETEEGKFPMITIAQNEHEFVGANNYQDTQRPLLNYFINLRGGSKQDYEIMAALLDDTEVPFDWDYITGIPDTGYNIAEPFAGRIGWPFKRILEKPTSGVDRKFDIGDAKVVYTDTSLVVDDLITGAATKIEAETLLNESGYRVGGHIVVVDRQEGGMEEMRRRGSNIVAGITATQIFSFALVNNMIDKDAYRRVMGGIKK